jgi:hypothetical protein
MKSKKDIMKRIKQLDKWLNAELTDEEVQGFIQLLNRKETKEEMLAMRRMILAFLKLGEKRALKWVMR